MTMNDKRRVPVRASGSPRAGTIGVGLLCFIAQVSLFVNPVSASSSEEVSKAVGELEQMRCARKPTFFEDEERRAGELLAKFTDPKDQGQICFELLHVYGQSGGPPPRIIECAKNAIQFPLEPQQKLRLYLYWGDALLHLNPGHPSVNRQIAAAVYLDGVKEYRKIKSEQAQGGAKVTLDATSARDMTLYYEVILAQTRVAYSSLPYAPADELRDLVIEKTGDPELAGRMDKAVEEAKAKMPVHKYRPSALSHAGALNPPPRRIGAVPLLAGLLVIFSAVLIGRRWYWRRRVTS